MTKLYLFSAINYDIEPRNNLDSPNTIIYSGYFSNLKKLYEVISKSKTKSYSSIARDMQKSKTVILENVSVSIDGGTVNVKKVMITMVTLNQLYRERKKVDFETYIISELYRSHLGLFNPIRN